MLVERWTIKDRAEWLRRRKANINGSEIGALFAYSPYMTPYALWADKSGRAELSEPDNEVLRRGRILEPAVAAAVREERPDWALQKATDYVWSSQVRLGCTPDFIVHCPQRGVGVLQAKTVAKPIFEEGWQAGPPQWIVLQALLEMMLENVSWGAIGVLVTGTYSIDCKVFEFTRHPAAEAKLIAAAQRFWEYVDAGRAPPPDYARDDDVIKALFPRDNGVMLDLTGDNRMPELLDRYETLKAMEGHAEKEMRAIKAEIAAKLGDAAGATLPGWEITNRTQTRKECVMKETTFRVLRVKRLSEERKAA
jgi:predicted phage-related endonuclease